MSDTASLTAECPMHEEAVVPSADGADLVTVARFGEVWEAHIFRARLEADGIFATVADEHLVNADWFLSSAVGGVRVQVREKDLAAASNIEAAVHRGEYALAEAGDGADTPACPRCGSTAIEPDAFRRNAAFFIFWLTSVPLPFSRHRQTCIDCHHGWKA